MEKIIFTVILVLYAVVCFMMCYFMMCYLVIASNNPKNYAHCYVERYADGSLWLYVDKAFRKRDRFILNSRIRLSHQGVFEYFGLNEKDFNNLKWGDEPVEVFKK